MAATIEEFSGFDRVSFLILKRGNGGVIHADADACHNAGEAAGWVTR
jgi:hypothetical protein